MTGWIEFASQLQGFTQRSRTLTRHPNPGQISCGRDGKVQISHIIWRTRTVGSRHPLPGQFLCVQNGGPSLDVHAMRGLLGPQEFYQEAGGEDGHGSGHIHDHSDCGKSRLQVLGVRRTDADGDHTFKTMTVYAQYIGAVFLGGGTVTFFLGDS